MAQVGRPMSVAGKAVRALLSAPIVAYQRFISPALGPRLSLIHI